MTWDNISDIQKNYFLKFYALTKGRTHTASEIFNIACDTIDIMLDDAEIVLSTNRPDQIHVNCKSCCGTTIVIDLDNYEHRDYLCRSCTLDEQEQVKNEQEEKEHIEAELKSFENDFYRRYGK